MNLKHFAWLPAMLLACAGAADTQAAGLARRVGIGAGPGYQAGYETGYAGAYGGLPYGVYGTSYIGRCGWCEGIWDGYCNSGCHGGFGCHHGRCGSAFGACGGGWRGGLFHGLKHSCKSCKVADEGCCGEATATDAPMEKSPAPAAPTAPESAPST
jgi:hypothetical protein